MILTKANHDLDRLVEFLIDEGRIAAHWKDELKVVNDFENDRRNQKDPRAFAHAVERSPVIHATRALEWVEPRVRFGILLHEVGHIALNEFKGDVCEVHVDEWCMFKVPESGYRYTDIEYPSPWLAAVVCRARNVQSVDIPFVHLMELY